MLAVFEIEDNDRGVILSYFVIRRNTCDAPKESRFFNRLQHSDGVSNPHIRPVDHNAEIPRESYVEFTTSERTSTAPLFKPSALNPVWRARMARVTAVCRGVALPFLEKRFQTFPSNQPLAATQ